MRMALRAAMATGSRLQTRVALAMPAGAARCCQCTGSAPCPGCTAWAPDLRNLQLSLMIAAVSLEGGPIRETTAARVVTAVMRFAGAGGGGAAGLATRPSDPAQSVRRPPLVMELAALREADTGGLSIAISRPK